MKEKEKKDKKKYSVGYILMSIYVSILAAIAVVFALLGSRLFGEVLPYLIITIVLLLLTTISNVARYYCRTKKWADIMCIVLGALTGFLGIFAILGGVFCMKDLENAKKNANMKNNTETNNKANTSAATTANCKYKTFGEYLQANPVDYETKPNIAPICDPHSNEDIHMLDKNGNELILAQLYLKIMADELYLLTQNITTEEVKDNKMVLRIDYYNDSYSIEYRDDFILEMMKSYNKKYENITTNPDPIITDYLQTHPIAYATKPNIAQIFDQENTNNMYIENDDGINFELERLLTKGINGNIYCLANILNVSKEEEGGAIVLSVNYEKDCFEIEQSDEIFDMMANAYDNAKTNVSTNKEKSSSKQILTLDLYDSSIDEKTWKTFKKTATQEELAIIAIGAKYRLSNLKRRILNAVCFVAMILCFALIPVTAFQSLIAYPFIAFFATKSIRYTDTYLQSYNKIHKQNRYLVDDYFNENMFLIIFDYIIHIGMFFVTIPYQALMLGIGIFAPNFVVSKNGILVSIPKGFDVGDLGAVGDYYSSFNFSEEFVESTTEFNKPSNSDHSPTDNYYKQDEYTYTDKFGYEQTVYSQDGKDFYDVGGKYIGSDGDKYKIKK